MQMIIAAAVYEAIMMWMACVAAVAATAFSVAWSAQQKSKERGYRDEAIKNYYASLQKGKTESTVQKSAKASAHNMKFAGMQATSVSEQMVSEAAAREQFSRQYQTKSNKAGFKPRTLKQRQKDFGNKKVGEFVEFPAESITLLDDQDVFKPSNFGVQNLNTNYFN